MEDSPAGVTAAIAAEMRVLGYAVSATPPDQLSAADYVFTAMSVLPSLLP